MVMAGHIYLIFDLITSRHRLFIESTSLRHISTEIFADSSRIFCYKCSLLVMLLVLSDFHLVNSMWGLWGNIFCKHEYVFCIVILLKFTNCRQIFSKAQQDVFINKTIHFVFNSYYKISTRCRKTSSCHGVSTIVFNCWFFILQIMSRSKRTPYISPIFWVILCFVTP